MSLQDTYKTKIQAELTKELSLTNPMMVPKLTKIVVNVGLGEALGDHKVIDRVTEQLAIITGQKPAIARAKISISAFKLRVGDKVGIKVTMRGKRMYDFFEKLVRIVLPRMRDFRGVKKTAFDGRGNYNLGLTEQTIFPEIEYAKIDKVRGMELTFVTTAGNDKAGLLLLSKLGMPFEKTPNERVKKVTK